MFKIKSRKVSRTEYIIEVWENETIIQTRLAKDILDRDRIIFELSDLHNIIDVEHINIMENTKEIKRKEKVTDIPVIPYTDAFQMESYFDSNNVYIFDRILAAIEDGISHRKKKIKLFEINNSGIFVDSLKRDWPAGLRLAHEFYLQEELYDKCDKCIELLTKLKVKL